MSRRITTVTHPDGTVSKRTSARATYGFALEVKWDKRAEGAEKRQAATQWKADSESMTEAVANGEITEQRRPWSGGREYVDLYINGHYATAYVTDRERPTDDAIRAALAEYAEHAFENATAYNRLATECETGPEFTYYVTRWSRTADLAEKGRNETRLIGRSTARVVPVEVKA